ncbi:hypothetical protein [Methylogaea oryzae]|uniref:Low-complexity protein n=1 Tax=Methylogaea oryzae TaxID=1295382 RepID=A0A8D4VUB4_9GAMM|nr:hypothetical protein [Methylogaea oryzae]BBL72634.1 hypothetical protein MoryE10_32400 [Methylogaea oryzae]
MSNTFDKKGLAALAGAAVVTSLSATAVNAQENPFALKDLSAGYMQVAEQKEMTCGEGKCGGSMMKEGQPKKDMAGMKGMEGKCAGNMQGGQQAAPGAAPAPATGGAAPAPAPAAPMKH